MTDQKDLKTHIRERMAKTGERYSTARMHVLGGSHAAAPAQPPVPANPPVSEPAANAAPGFIDETAFRRFFPEDKRGASQTLDWCRAFAAHFDSPDRFLDACAAMMSGPLEALVTEDLRPASTGYGPRSLVGEPKGGDPPGTDHESVWECDGKPMVCFSQPYELDMDTLGRMISWCRRNGMTFRISGGSWYFPGSTVLVEFSRAPKDGA